jgi:hypothetical protein
MGRRVVTQASGVGMEDGVRPARRRGSVAPLATGKNRFYHLWAGLIRRKAYLRTWVLLHDSLGRLSLMWPKRG